MTIVQPTRYIGSYQILDHLGEGSFGRVYRAYQPFLEREVAIKILHDDFFEQTTSEKLFMREGRTIARLRHPNIVNDIGLVLLQSFLPILIAIGVHRIQKQLGTTGSRFVVMPTAS